MFFGRSIAIILVVWPVISTPNMLNGRDASLSKVYWKTGNETIKNHWQNGKNTSCHLWIALTMNSFGISKYSFSFLHSFTSTSPFQSIWFTWTLHIFRHKQTNLEMCARLLALSPLSFAHKRRKIILAIIWIQRMFVSKAVKTGSMLIPNNDVSKHNIYCLWTLSHWSIHTHTPNTQSQSHSLRHARTQTSRIVCALGIFLLRSLLQFLYNHMTCCCSIHHFFSDAWFIKWTRQQFRHSHTICVLPQNSITLKNAMNSIKYLRFLIIHDSSFHSKKKTC